MLSFLNFEIILISIHLSIIFYSYFINFYLNHQLTIIINDEMAYKVLIPVLAVLATVRWTTGNPRPMEFNGNLAMPIDITGEAMSKFLRRNEYQNSPKDMIQNVDRNSRAIGINNKTNTTFNKIDLIWFCLKH